MSRPSARPKRAAEDYVRTHENDADGAPSKKPRFDVRNPSALAPDALENDATLDADVIGGRGQQVRRNAVNIDGYDSDSENEGFDARADAKAKKKQAESKDEEENDMFADPAEDVKDGDDSEGDDTRKGGKKKAVRFLDEDEIEGQVLNSKSGGHVSVDFSLNRHANGKGKGKAVKDDEVESSTDSDVDDEVRAAVGEDMDEEIGAGGKKAHAPKLDAFNMRTENEEGRFDDQGNYVRKAADPDAVHDTWLEGLSKKDMKKAKEAADKRDEDRRKRSAQDDAILTSDVLRQLIPMLERGETVLDALARFGKGKDRKPKWQNKNKNKNKNRKKHESSVGDVDMGQDDPAEFRRKEAVEAITAAADLLLTRGQPEIYDAERELLVRQYRKETGEEWTEPDSSQTGASDGTETNFWEYRWSDARDGAEVHGPYEESMMRQWNEAGYFGEGVEFRRTLDGAEWARIAEFV
jgi:CD2 antigen cytoplasmic tail-binding protein 2